MDSETYTLFEIGNTDFGGVVRYKAHYEGGNIIVAANWCHGKGGDEYRGLNTVERTFAYGFKVVGDTLTIKSLKARPMKIINHENKLKATLPINGQNSILDYVFVTTKKTLGIPGVDHLDISGFRLDNGEPISEVYRK